jgi:acetoin utilization deacetylase AcuC-like enzyme
MTLLYSHPRFLDHDTGAHPESPERLEHIAARLESSGLAERCVRPTWEPASEARLLAVHDAAHIARVADLARRRGGRLDADTVVSADSFDVARLAAGAACDAVERVLRGEDFTALCVIRPPGHHALRNRAMGFCLFGNIAIAARCAIDECGLDRVLIVDWDVHHGNGTRICFTATAKWAFFRSTGGRFIRGAARPMRRGRATDWGRRAICRRRLALRGVSISRSSRAN